MGRGEQIPVVGEDHEVAHRVVNEPVLHRGRDRLVSAARGHPQMVPGAGEAEVILVGINAQDVHLVSGLGVADGVVPVPGGEDVGVGAFPAHQDVVAPSGKELVIAPSAGEGVVAVQTGNAVGKVVARK